MMEPIITPVELMALLKCSRVFCLDAYQDAYILMCHAMLTTLLIIQPPPSFPFAPTPCPKATMPCK